MYGSASNGVCRRKHGLYILAMRSGAVHTIVTVPFILTNYVVAVVVVVFLYFVILSNGGC